MQRNILKMALICGAALLLTFTPINSLYAAEDAVETNVNLEESVSGTYYVNTQHGLKMRSAPSTDAEVITLLPYKAKITVTEAATDSWYKAEYANQSGYVAADYVTKSSAPDTSPETEDAKTTETQENASLPETSSATAANGNFGATPIITALIAAIIIMAFLAMYTAYSFLKKGNDGYDDEYDDEYSADNAYPDDGETIDNDDEYGYDKEYDDE